jgi:TetR/AcrR family transcriptional regulator, copper-responsive repressor
MLQRVPVFCNFPVLNSVEIVIRRDAIAEAPLAHNKDEITFPEHFVNALVLHHLALLGKGLQPGDQAGQVISDPRVVLDIVIAVKVARKFIPAALQEVIHVGLHQGLVGLSLVQVRRRRRPVRHHMAAGIQLGGGILQVVPMLDHFSVFKAEDVKTHPVTDGKGVLGMGKHKVAILENAHDIHLGRPFRPGFHSCDESFHTIANGQVVLDVPAGVDVGEWLFVTRLDARQEFDDLLLVSTRHRVFSRNGYYEPHGSLVSIPFFFDHYAIAPDNALMTRPKNFSREGVLDKAIPVFWQRGFADTSLQDLEKATRVNKSGLYTEFRDKEDLFIASLRHYLDTLNAEETMSTQPLGWSNVEQFLKYSYGCRGQKGCFSVNSMREYAVLPPEARELMKDSLVLLKRLLLKNIQAEKSAMEPGVIADLVLTFFSGLCVEQNLQPSKAHITRKIENFMQMLRKM